MLYASHLHSACGLHACILQAFCIHDVRILSALCVHAVRFLHALYMRYDYMSAQSIHLLRVHVVCFLQTIRVHSVCILHAPRRSSGRTHRNQNTQGARLGYFGPVCPWGNLYAFVHACCMHYIWRSACMHPVCILDALCTHSVCIAHAFCMHSVCVIHTICMHMRVICIYYVCILYAFCIRSVYILYKFCTHPDARVAEHTGIGIPRVHNWDTFGLVGPRGNLYAFVFCMHASCMHSACITYAFCPHCACILHAFCIRFVCIIHAVCSCVQLKFIMCAFCEYAFCEHSVYIPYASCTPPDAPAAERTGIRKPRVHNWDTFGLVGPWGNLYAFVYACCMHYICIPPAFACMHSVCLLHALCTHSLCIVLHSVCILLVCIMHAFCMHLQPIYIYYVCILCAFCIQSAYIPHAFCTQPDAPVAERTGISIPRVHNWDTFGLTGLWGNLYAFVYACCMRYICIPAFCMQVSCMLFACIVCAFCPHCACILHAFCLHLVRIMHAFCMHLRAIYIYYVCILDALCIRSVFTPYAFCSHPDALVAERTGIGIPRVHDWDTFGLVGPEGGNL